MRHLLYRLHRFVVKSKVQRANNSTVIQVTRTLFVGKHCKTLLDYLINYGYSKQVDPSTLKRVTENLLGLVPSSNATPLS